MRSATKIPDWQKFLRLENLCELQDPLVGHVEELENGKEKKTLPNMILKLFPTRARFNTDDLGPCSHEEAHYRMMLYVADMFKQNITKILIVNNARKL